MDDVRVHRNSAEPAKLDAFAFARGSEIHLGPGQDQHLPHEAWHVVQQKQGRVKANTQIMEAAVSDDSALETEADAFARQALTDVHGDVSTRAACCAAQGQPIVQRQAKPEQVAPGVSEQVMGRADVAERSRTVVRIEVVGHASPRWRGARDSQEAESLNWRLAERRARQVRLEVERLLNDLLPNRDLVFDYRFRPATERASDVPVRAIDEPADVMLDFKGRGSTETMGEAGKRGRSANDAQMRRVDINVTLHSQGETDVEEDIERRERLPGASNDWSLWVTLQAGGGAFGATTGVIILKLRNEKTQEIGTLMGTYGGGGATFGASVSAKTSIPDFERFKTPEAMIFADFHNCEIGINSIGFALGLGLEWAELRFLRFRGGESTPDAINIGSLSDLSLGGIELNLGSWVEGVLALVDHPSEEYTRVTRMKRTRTYEALGAEASGHRVLFATASSDIGSWESDELNAYLVGVLTRSGL